MAYHYIPTYAPVNGRRYKAACGVYILAGEHSLEPECPACRQLIAEDGARDADDEAALAALQAMPAGPEPTLNTFDALAGYRRKESAHGSRNR